MARRARRNHSPAFKAKVAVAAIKGESEGEFAMLPPLVRGHGGRPRWGGVSPRTLVELAQDFDLHPNQIKQWRDHLLGGATGVFGEAPKGDAEPRIDVKTLHAKIGELTLENDFLSGALGKAGLLSRCSAVHRAAMSREGAQKDD